MNQQVEIKASFSPRIISVKPKSLLARIAARVLMADAAAIVFGHHIHVWGVSASRFALQTPWLQHELMHVKQYCHHGFAGFLFRYVWLWMKHGYKKHPMELEAVAAEQNPPFGYHLTVAD